MPLATCRHCRVSKVDADQPETGLCPECLDLAVYAASCPSCGRVPTGKARDRCDD